MKINKIFLLKTSKHADKYRRLQRSINYESCEKDCEIQVHFKTLFGAPVWSGKKIASLRLPPELHKTLVANRINRWKTRRMQKIIDAVPHNLNGHTVSFVLPTDGLLHMNPRFIQISEYANGNVQVD
jgi:hypothetical protein